VTGRSTFVFADLAGFTALTEAHGDAEALQIASDFVSTVRTILAECGAEEVKTIGDEVMIRVEDPGEAVRLGIQIVDRLAAHRSPPVRVGMHSGSAIASAGDWFGSTVNIASRVTDAAKPGEVLLTDATRTLLGDLDGIELERLGQRAFKHVPELTPVYRAVEREGDRRQFEVDPVCRMAVDPQRAVSARRRWGIPYFFCSEECRRAFDEGPRRYIATTAGARAARKGFLINLGAFAILGSAHLAVWAARGFSDASPGMLVIFLVWAIALVIHYRTVRSVL